MATPIACSVQGERAAIDDNRSKASSAPSVALVDFIKGKDGAAMLRACGGYDGGGADKRFKTSA
ncbi:hypothetical protein [Xanthomonas sp. SI]|uniref:hypothetical protein n=1 Tax=Xanthomonas sp. SI TaxID=2724123 RepID=UPI00163AA287|nr:hypothetical protein [Xanthomonas sp. SI]